MQRDFWEVRERAHSAAASKFLHAHTHTHTHEHEAKQSGETTNAAHLLPWPT